MHVGVAHVLCVAFVILFVVYRLTDSDYCYNTCVNSTQRVAKGTFLALDGPSRCCHNHFSGVPLILFRQTEGQQFSP